MMNPTSEERLRQAEILIVEDDAGLRSLLADELRERGPYDVRCASNVHDALGELAARAPDVVLTDLRMPGENGIALLPTVKQMSSAPAFVIMTAFGSIPQAVEALKQGADDFLTKPLDLDHLVLRIERLLDVHRLKALVRHMRPNLEAGSLHGLLGRSSSMQQLFRELRQVAQAAGPVLIVGETGVGKERVARAIHEESPRRRGPFVAVNCAAIPESLVESELFGHVTGAFTGADRKRGGLFVQAEGGTLLLDEITELPGATQAKLLRVLQEGMVRPVGADDERSVDVRVVGATNRGIQRAVETGEFREDLYYRLETFLLHVPPLRARHDDIDLLAAHFLAAFLHETPKPIEGFSEEALDALRSYPFPGNVRELQNVIERAVAFCNGARIDVEHLGARILDHVKKAGRAETVLPLLVSNEALPTLDEVKLRYVHHVLERQGGNKRRAAQILDIGRRTLYRYLEPYE